MCLAEEPQSDAAAAFVCQHCLMTIVYTQGVYGPSTFKMLQLPSEWYNALEWQYPPHQVSLSLLLSPYCCAEHVQLMRASTFCHL